MSPPPIAELFRVFGRIGLLSFGGPAAQIALMHRELVETRPWLAEQTFLRALSLCMLLPGPEAMQLATYAGWRLRGTFGGLVAGLLFILPGAFVISVLALFYAKMGEVLYVQAAFTGIKATVIVIVLQALGKISAKALRGKSALVFAAATFTALFVFNTPYPLIILTAACVGAVLSTDVPAIDKPTAPPSKHTLTTLLVWGSAWAAPVVLISAIDAGFLMQVASLFSKLAVVTFGGAYAVLSYMTQTVVTDYNWLTTPQMIDALGLAETTPGPLILVTQFVAMFAGYAQQGPLLAVAAGMVALWVTFTPCFLWIFLAGPYLEQIAARPRLAAALSAITAAVVGVILNLAIWFAIHVLFDAQRDVAWVASPLPELSSLNFNAFVLTCLAAVLLIWLKIGMGKVLGIMALAGLCLSA